MVAGRRLAREPLDDQIGPQAAQHLDEKVDVLADLPEAEATGVGVVFGGHRRAAEYLQLMEFQRRERQRIDRRDLLQQHRVRLARQSEDKVRPDVQSPRGGHLHGAARAGEVMPAVHRPQRLVAGRFDAVLDGHVPPARQLREIVQLFGVHAVGPRADDDARHVGMRQRLAVHLLQPLQRRIGVRKRLEVDQILRRRAVTPAVELDPLLDLPPHPLDRHAVRGSERPVVAERTSSPAYRSVPVGTREPGVHRQFLHAAAEHAAKIPRIGVEPPVIAPRIHRYNPQSEGL